VQYRCKLHNYSNMNSDKVRYAILVVLVLGFGCWVLIDRNNSVDSRITIGSTPTLAPSPLTSPTSTPLPTSVFTPVATSAPPKPSTPPQSSIDNPASITVVVNKQRPLQPMDYAPADLVAVYNGYLRATAASALNSMLFQAQVEGVGIKNISSYRSYSTQKSLYDSYVAQDGVALADTYSARPGYSEHQTGLATDVGDVDGLCEFYICFADTPAGLWLSNNAHRYGFIIRYPYGKTDITGYQYEPWHVRYVGIDVATAIFNQQTTLEQYFGLPPAPVY
jgi:D-alanyl-D-alanine carboxypeptidase